MKQVLMYECEFCKKLFRTPNRHQCKYDPKYRNCFSCEHNHGFDSDEYDGQLSIYLMCSHQNDTVDAREAREPCGAYEYCGGKWFENKYHKEKEKEQEKKDKKARKEFEAMFRNKGGTNG